MRKIFFTIWLAFALLLLTFTVLPMCGVDILTLHETKIIFGCSGLAVVFVTYYYSFHLYCRERQTGHSFEALVAFAKEILTTE